MNTIGKTLLELRKQKGISQEMLAIDLKISQSSISNYESDTTKPDIGTLQKIAEYFKIPVACFFDEKTTPYANEQNESKNGNTINCTRIILSEKLIDLYEKKIIFLEEELRKLKEK